ncbi:hypothetical protein Q5P01_004369 [Channa striata]|uniref:Uncharacterized protein n=1 Tax=Channa striata TaxID=64152 RepID=A0AA88NIT0_CHASR|nr:hypothetical protein Q5P01_004369 [Channa striata]
MDKFGGAGHRRGQESPPRGTHVNKTANAESSSKPETFRLARDFFFSQVDLRTFNSMDLDELAVHHHFCGFTFLGYFSNWSKENLCSDHISKKIIPSRCLCTPLLTAESVYAG